MQEYIDKATELGYTVELAFDTADGDKVWRVKGFGIDTMYSERDNEAEWKFLVLPEAHEHRANMMRHNDPKNEFIMNNEEQRESAIKASKAAGLYIVEE
jgi:hypothetical protein